MLFKYPKTIAALLLFASSSEAQISLEINTSINQLESQQIGSSIDLFHQPSNFDLSLVKFPANSLELKVNPVIDLELFNTSPNYRNILKNTFNEGFLIIQTDRTRPMPGALPEVDSPYILDSDRELLNLCRSSSSDYKVCRSTGSCGNSDLMFGRYCNYSATNISERIGWGTNEDYFESTPILENSVVIVTDKPVCSGLLVPDQSNQHSNLVTALHCHSQINSCKNKPECTPRVFKLSSFESSSVMNLKRYEENLDLAVYGLNENIRSSRLEFVDFPPFPEPAVVAGAGRVSAISFADKEHMSQEDIARATSMLSAPYTLCQIMCSGNNRIYHSCQTTESTSGAPIYIKNDETVKIAGIHLTNEPGGECGENVQESLSGMVIAQFLREARL